MRKNPRFCHLRELVTRALMLFVAFVALVSFAMPAFAQTAASQSNAQAVAVAAGLPQTDLPTLIGRIIYVFLSLLGTVFLVLLLYAGFLWMTSQGDPKKVEKAKNIIRDAIIGIVLTASAFAITSFILGLLASNGNFGSILGGGGGKAGNGFATSAGSLGGGIIESTVPQRDEKDVPRNTPIMVTFKQAIDPASFIAGWTEATSNTADGLNADNIKIYVTENGVTTAIPSDKAHVKYTSDEKTFVIRPVDLLGSPVNNTDYTVALAGGNSGIKLTDETPAFTGTFNDGYIWQFQVSTKVDLTPPKVIDVVPASGGSFARNVVIQINFDHAMDPTAVSGSTTSGFQNIEVLATPAGGSNPEPVEGRFDVSNQYHTVEFTTDEKCEPSVNSCGQTVYCLPGNATIQVTAKAATLASPDSPQANYTASGYDGVASITGNSLDGNADGKAEGPPADNYATPSPWTFQTTDEVKITPPQIESTVPSSDPDTGGNSGVPVDEPVVAKFDSRLRSSTLNSTNATINAHGKGETVQDTFWWTVGMQLLNSDGTLYDPNATPPQTPTKSGLVIDHRTYLPSGTTPDSLNYYDPYIYQGVQDIYQNCFNPAALCGHDAGTKDTASDMTAAGLANCCNSDPTNAACKDFFPKTP